MLKTLILQMKTELINSFWDTKDKSMKENSQERKFPFQSMFQLSIIYAPSRHRRPTRPACLYENQSADRDLQVTVNELLTV